MFLGAIPGDGCEKGRRIIPKEEAKSLYVPMNLSDREIGQLRRKGTSVIEAKINWGHHQVIRTLQI